MAHDVTDAELEAAGRRGRELEQRTPMAAGVRYDAVSGRLAIDFVNGSTLLVPARQLQDLQDASDADLAEVRLEFGYGLRWETLDVDFTVAGLMAGIFGTVSFMEAQRRGGQSRSPAKSAAARENGKKGGRPRRPASAA